MKGDPTGKADILGQPLFIGDWVVIPWSGCGHPASTLALVSDVGRTGKVKVIVCQRQNGTSFFQRGSNSPHWSIDLKVPAAQASCWIKVNPDIVPADLLVQLQSIADTETCKMLQTV